LAGHLGVDLVTTQNLDVIRIDEARQLLMIKVLFLVRLVL
jgi:large subunit ribosomal protein L3